MDELARLVLVTAHAEERMSHARIRELTDQHSRDVTLKLQELVRNGFLVSAGGGRGTTYSLTTDAAGGEAPLSGLPLFYGVPDDDGDSRKSSRKNSRKSSRKSGDGLPQSPTGSSDSQTTSIVAHVASTAWSSQDDMRMAILELCASDYQTAAEIAEALNRKPATIQRIYLSAMATDGTLERRYPNARNHPAQAYRATPTVPPREESQ